jgi:phage tail sheath protein FI
MTYQRPGVFVQETLNPIQPVVGPNSSTVAAFIGSAVRGPTTPTLISSWSQATRLYGTWIENSGNTALLMAINLFFQNGGSQCYVNRIVGAGAAVASRTLLDRANTPVNTLIVSAKNSGAWGNNINISISDSTVTGYFDITVFYGGNAAVNVVERFTDLTLVSPDPRFASSIVNPNSIFISIAAVASNTAGSNKNPSVITNQALTGGVAGSAPTDAAYLDGFEDFETIESSLLFNAPGVVTASPINTFINYCATRKDAFLVIDGLEDTVAQQLTRSAAYTPSSYAAVYYPNIIVQNPITPTSISYAFVGAAVMGIYASTDASRGVFKAPAGLSARIAGAVSVTSLTSAELDSLNAAAAPVNAIRFVPGSGIVVMGAKTLKAGYVDKYIPVRRTLIYLSKSLTDLTKFAIFEPNDARLWRQIVNTCESFLTDFWQQGGLAGATPTSAFFVKCDTTTNPQGLIDNGQVNLEIGVALQRPAEFIIIKIGQYDGGTSVITA